MASTNSKLVLYGLQAKADGGQFNFSPHTWKIHLSLEYLGVPHTHVNLSFPQIGAELTDKYKAQFPDFKGKATVPILQLEDGRLLMDSWTIAEYLDETYARPAGKTLIGGSTGHSLARFVDRLWVKRISEPHTSTLVQVATVDKLDAPSREYYVQSRFGSEAKFEAVRASVSDPTEEAARLQQAREQLQVIEEVLEANQRYLHRQPHSLRNGHPDKGGANSPDHGKPSGHSDPVGPLIGGTQLSYADFVLFGYSCWSRLHPAVGPALWENGKLPHLADWVSRMRARFIKDDAELVSSR